MKRHQHYRFLKLGEVVRKGDLCGFGLNYLNGWKLTSDHGKIIDTHSLGWYLRPVK